nr:hypothetical protein [Kibdelosporangium sp. MJ126-NF4]CTQ90674.1 hypothetical protein [Kibdelosporangium sp. MJ126-NF4]
MAALGANVGRDDLKAGRNQARHHGAANSADSDNTDLHRHLQEPELTPQGT